MAWIVFVPGSYTLIQSVWVQSKVLVKAAAKWEFSGLFLIGKSERQCNIPDLPICHSLPTPCSKFCPFTEAGSTWKDWYFLEVWGFLSWALWLEEHSHPQSWGNRLWVSQTKGKQECVAEHRPRAERWGIFCTSQLFTGGKPWQHDCRWLKGFFSHFPWITNSDEFWTESSHSH